jgi:hypothetical protein
MRSGSVDHDRCDGQGHRSEADAGVGDLAGQALRLQVDPRLDDQDRHQDAVRRDGGPRVVEADRHQHVQRGVRQLDHDRVDADRCPTAPAPAAQGEPAEHRHQIERAEAEPARTAATRWCIHREALRHPIHHHRQERADHQTGDDHDHDQQRKAHQVRPSVARAGG